MARQRVSRRAVLSVSGVAIATSVAGCLGGGNDGDGGDGSQNQTTTTGGSPDQTTTTDGSPESTVSDLPTPTMGPDDATVTVAAYEDFVCPHCRTFSLEILPEITGEYVESGQVQYEHHDFPLPLSQMSWSTPIAARSIQDNEGQDAFWKFVKAAFRNQDSLNLETIRELANQVGADGERVVADAQNEVYRPVVESDRQAGRQKGVGSTPTVFVNGQQLGNYSADRISRAIESEL